MTGRFLLDFEALGPQYSGDAGGEDADVSGQEPPADIPTSQVALVAGQPGSYSPVAPGGPVITVDSAADFAEWVARLGAARMRNGEPFVDRNGTRLYQGYGEWQGMDFSLTAFVKPDPEPEENTEDLTEVRKLAGGAS